MFPIQSDYLSVSVLSDRIGGLKFNCGFSRFCFSTFQPKINTILFKWKNFNTPRGNPSVRTQNETLCITFKCFLILNPTPSGSAKIMSICREFTYRFKKKKRITELDMQPYHHPTHSTQIINSKQNLSKRDKIVIFVFKLKRLCFR